MNLLLRQVLTKRKVALDQLHKGLESLGVLSLIHKHTELMKVYFVKSKEDLTRNILINKVFKNVNKEEAIEEKEKARTFFLQSLDAMYDGKNLQFVLAKLGNTHSCEYEV